MIRVVTPPVRYAKSGDAHIAYQVVGDGPIDLVYVGGPAAHLDMEWENPLAARAMEETGRFARLVRLDRRGTGLSDPLVGPPTLDQQMDDLRAVMDAVGLERAALFGGTDAGLGAMFAGTHPDRITALVLWGVAARAADAITPELAEKFADVLEHYGEGRSIDIYAPSRKGDARFEEWWARYERAAGSPSTARQLLELTVQTDISAILPAIRVPTLVMHRSGDVLVPIELGRDVAARIPDAKFVEIPGTDPYGWASDIDPALDVLEEFLTGSLGARERDRVLATVLFTDVVGSTEHAARVGDRRWRELLEGHDAAIRRQLGRFRGREVKTVGDGFLATFDRPGHAVLCADAIVKSVEPIGLEVRTGVHTGEIELIGDDVGGIAVHIGARVAALAGGGEVVVSSTVKDLVVGSGLDFADLGTHELKGAPGEWQLFSLRDGD